MKENRNPMITVQAKRKKGKRNLLPVLLLAIVLAGCRTPEEHGTAAVSETAAQSAGQEKESLAESGTEPAADFSWMEETDAGGAAETADAETADAGQSVPEASETEAPETEAPETEATETKSPGTEAPETEASGANASGTEAPEAANKAAESGRKSAAADGYCYQRLGGAEQAVYEEVYQSLAHLEAETEVSTQDTAVLEQVFAAVMNDHPELFYVDGYHFTQYLRGEKMVKLEFTGNFFLEAEEVKERKAQIEAIADAWLAGLPQGSEYEKIKYLYETLIRNTEYQIDAVWNQSMASVFLYGKSVCQGYAKAMQYLLHRAGMECTLATGSVNGEGHAWDVVKADGAWYHVDPTWGDASYLFGGSGSEETSREVVNYDYLCVTTEQLKRTHRIQDEETLPVCDSEEGSYYRKEGLFFEQPDEAKLEELFAEALARQQASVTFQCADEATWLWMKEYLLEEQNVFSYLGQTDGSVAYFDSEEQLTLGFWL